MKNTGSTLSRRVRPLQANERRRQLWRRHTARLIGRRANWFLENRAEQTEALGETNSGHQDKDKD